MHTPNTLTAPDVVEDQMALVRARLHRDSAACQQARERWTDWKTHVKAHPWLACGVAAALGYALVPSRRREPHALPLQTAAFLPVPQRETSLVGRLAAELGRRAAQQALSVGAAWALAKVAAHQATRDPSGTNGHVDPQQHVASEFSP